jgi:hypothetical protein
VHADTAIDEEAWQGTDRHRMFSLPCSQQKIFLCFIPEVDWHGSQFRNTPGSSGPESVTGSFPSRANFIVDCGIDDSFHADRAKRGIVGYGCAAEGFKIQVMRLEYPAHSFFGLAHGISISLY